MSRPLLRAGAAAAALLANGCAFQLGSVAGHAIALDPDRGQDRPRDTGQFMWTGQAAGSTVLGKERGVLLGGEIESRTEYRIGARWTAGTWLGYAWLPRRERWARGFEIHGDFGTRFEDGALFAQGNYYAGSTAALVLWASERHDAFDADATPWMLVRALEVVAGGRTRCNVDDRAGGDWGSRCDVGVSLSLRLRVVSDLIE